MNMKNFLLPLMAICVLGGFFLSSCGDDEPEVVLPAITGVVDVDDVEITSASVGSVIFIEGTGFSGAMVTMNGVEVTPSLINDNSITIQIPSSVPTIATDQSVNNEIIVTIPNVDGEDLVLTYEFNILPGGPVVTSLSTEFGTEGDNITIWGESFFFVEKVVFPGDVEVMASDLDISEDGKSISLKVPATSEAGVVMVVTQSGSDDSAPAYSFNDVSNVLLNWDDRAFWQNWAGVDLLTDESNGSYFRAFQETSVTVFSWWIEATSFVVDGTADTQGLTPSNLTGAASDYVIRMDVNVPASTPWFSGWFEMEAKTASGTNVYGRLMPWTAPFIGGTNNYMIWEFPDPKDIGPDSAFHTNGEWAIIEYPVNFFFPKDSNGNPLASQAVTDISELFSQDNNDRLWIRFVFQNPGHFEAASENPDVFSNGGFDMPNGIDISIDNIRIVKVN